MKRETYEPVEPEYERGVQETPESLALRKIDSKVRYKTVRNKLREAHHEFIY